MNTFHGDRLKKARLYRGLTVEELAEKINVSKQTISQYENEKIIPSFEKILALINTLSFPYEYFYQEDDTKIELKSVYFRSLLKTSKKHRTEQCIKIEHLASIYSFLSDYINFPKLNLPQNLEYSSPIEAARFIRDFWGLGEEPITNLINVIEANGLIVTTFPTSTDEIDAFSQLVKINGEDVYLIVLSSNKKAAVRSNFDIAHELGHILLHEWSEDIESLSREQFRQREKEANQFAAEFLLPREYFLKNIIKDYASNINYYVNIKEKWHVSIAAMIHRACDLDIINQNQYQYMMRIMQKKGWRKKEPLDEKIVNHKPSLLIDAVRLLLDNNVFTTSDFVAQLSNKGLAMEASEIENLLNLPKEMLSLFEEKVIQFPSIKLKQ